MVTVNVCDYTDPKQRKAIVELLNHYMADHMGGELPPYTKDTAEKVITGLQEHPSGLVLLAEYSGKYVGLAVCFINFASFTAKPFINIHDIVVLVQYRGMGIGRRLMEAVCAKARELGCGKITLEVREDNTYAQRLYKSMGYSESKPVMHFWTKYLL